MRRRLCYVLCCVCASVCADFVGNDAETVFEAARAIDEEVPWAAGSTMLRGCVSDISPLTVAIEYQHRDDASHRIVRAFRPWRTATWRVHDDGVKPIGCGVDAHVTTDGRARHIVEVTKRAWNAYVSRRDTLTRSGINNYGEAAITAIDSLDTLWLMGLHDEFEAACIIVNATRFDANASVKRIEMMTRAIGGLLSAYSLSGRDWLLRRAIELGAYILRAFDAYGIPPSDIRLKSGRARSPEWNASFSSAISLEFKHLAQLSNYSKISMIVEQADRRMRATVQNKGDARPPSLPAVTPMEHGDVKLEARPNLYLLKEWTRSNDERYRDAFVKSAYASRRLYRAVGDQLFVGEIHDGEFVRQMDHSVCLWPGVLALAVRIDVLPKAPFMDDAQRIVRACLRMHDTPHGLAPEKITFTDNRTCIDRRDTHNSLRPETLESLYIMWCVDGDDMYREFSWTIFENLEYAARVENGYASIQDITNSRMVHTDDMPSNFLAKTLKYAWLSAIKIDLTSDYVMQTERHLLPIHDIVAANLAKPPPP